MPKHDRKKYHRFLIKDYYSVINIIDLSFWFTHHSFQSTEKGRIGILLDFVWHEGLKPYAPQMYILKNYLFSRLRSYWQSNNLNLYLSLKSWKNWLRMQINQAEKKDCTFQHHRHFKLDQSGWSNKFISSTTWACSL